MPDITMCRDTTCPERNACYRYRAKPDEYRQSYFAEQVRNIRGCPYFSKIRQDANPDRLVPTGELP